MDQTDRLGKTWMLWTLVLSPGSDPVPVLHSLSTMYPTAIWGREREVGPRGKWVPQNSLGERGYGRKEEGKRTLRETVCLLFR